MAFKKTLIQRLFSMPKLSNSAVKNPRLSSAIPPDRVIPGPGDYAGASGGNYRSIHDSTLFNTASRNAALSPPIGSNLVETLRGMDMGRNRICLDGLIRPAPTAPPVEKSDDGGARLSISDAKKLWKVAQLEGVKRKLREEERSWMKFGEFLKVCGEGCSDPDQGAGFAKVLDQSGHVLVLGDIVYLRPEQQEKVTKGFQVVKSIERFIPRPVANPNDPRRKELEELEKQKFAIDRTAEKLVRRELWLGLGYLVAQTAAFMRLTFWELSWDVMEPICFYVTSIYFMAGYTFFLRTAKEPSFEGFYQSRFSAKQNRQMKIHNFDIRRYNELRQACYPRGLSSEQAPLFTPLFDKSSRGAGLHDVLPN